MERGLVYVLTSPNCPFVKICGTERPLAERLRGINGSSPYGAHGPWELLDCLQVVDWFSVEQRLHAQFGAHRTATVPGARELFGIPGSEARKALLATEPALRIGHAETEKLFRDYDFRNYLFRLFEITGIFGCTDLQGAWTLSLYPKTGGGRFFTLNIGTHEVAFSPLPEPKNGPSYHFLVADELILAYPDVEKWLVKHGGSADASPYASAKEGAVSIEFQATFAEAEGFLALRGARRALVAYWHDWLSEMRERRTRSLFARFHNYDAVQSLVDFRRARQAAVANE